MPEVLDPQIVRNAEEAARRPDFADVVARGRTLSRRRTATALTAVVVVLGGLVGVTQLPGRQEAVPVVPVDPTPTTSEAPLPSRRTATEEPRPEPPSVQEVVNHPESRLLHVRSLPGDPGRRVAHWSLCAEDCAYRYSAVVIADGSGEPKLVDEVWENIGVHVADEGDVVVTDHTRRLKISVIGQDGEITVVDMSRKSRPMADGEVLGGMDFHRSGTIFWATDTTTARAHTVPVPEDTHSVEQTDGGQLRALTNRGTYAWSDDGGATWTEHDGAVADGMLSGSVSSTDDTHVVLNGGDGATLFPFSQIRRLESDGTWTVTEASGDPMAYVGHTAVLPDGRFLATVQAWSDNGRWTGSIKGTLPGLYVSAGGDWSTYERIESGAPFDEPAFNQPWVTDIEVTEEGARLTAVGPDATSAWTSNDLGVSWSEMRVR